VPPPSPGTVLIDGVRYVPVSDANPSAAALEDAIIGQWGGDGWRTDYPHAPRILRVIVTDTAEDGEGETVTEFLARLLQAVSAAT
jgi:hypothetical protein